MIRHLDLFAGIGAFPRAMKNLGLPYKLVYFSEIDKWAAQCYCFLQNTTIDKNLGDVCKIDTDKLKDKGINVVTYGFPCTDISLAGYCKGLWETDKDTGERKPTRSGLVWQAHRIIADLMPEVAICENVKNLTSKRFTKEFQAILNNLSEIGYNNYWSILNAKDFGIPQNRERIFIVSIRKDIDNGTFRFPKPIPLQLRLKDMLDKEVDEKYYIDTDRVKYILDKIPEEKNCLEPVRLGGLFDTDKSKHQAGAIWGKESVAPTLDTAQGGYRQPLIVIKTNNAKGYDIAVDGDYLSTAQPSSSTRRGRIGHGVSQCLDTSGSNHCVVVQETIQFDRSGKIKYTDISNTLTANNPLRSMGKNNPITGVVETDKIITIGNYTPSNYGGTRIVDPNGIAPTVMENHGMPTAVALDEQNRYLRKDGCVGTLTTDGSSPKHNNRVVINDGNKLRIRKLTPYECLKLMGFTEKDGKKLTEAKISNTQIYKCAGNSICVPVIEHLISDDFLKSLFLES